MDTLASRVIRRTPRHRKVIGWARCKHGQPDRQRRDSLEIRRMERVPRQRAFRAESGGAVSAQDNRGWTPFHTASEFGHLHVAKFLLERGVAVDIRGRSEEVALSLASSIGKLDIVRFLIETGADIYAKDNKGSNPLHIASEIGTPRRRAAVNRHRNCS